MQSEDRTLTGQTTTRTEKQSGFKRFWRRNKYAYLFLSLWIIGGILWQVLPIGASLYLSFTDYDLADANYVGLENYLRMFRSDRRYDKALSVTFRYVFFGVPLQLLMALILAYLLHQGIPGLPVFRGLFYLPSLLGGSVAVALLWRRLFGVEGILNRILSVLGLQSASPISWVTNPNYSLYTLILLLVWQFGSPMIIFLAGLKQIPSELYEAAAIDGASRRAAFYRITLPLLTPVIFFNLVMQIISAFQAFTPAFIVAGGSGGGPLDSLLFYTLYLYFKGFVEFRMGYASAMAWALLGIIAFFTVVLFRSSRSWVYYYGE